MRWLLAAFVFGSLFSGRRHRNLAALGCPLSGLEPGQLGSYQVQFRAIEQFPLDFFTGLQADGRRQRQGKIDVEPGLLAFGADGLNF